MKNRILVIAAALAAFALSGCATPKQTIAAGTPSLWLADPCERTTTHWPKMNMRFPAGEYRPSFRDDGGIYYSPPSAIIGHFGDPFSDWSVYVGTNNTQAVYMGGGPVAHPMDRPLPFTSAPAAKPGDTTSR